MATLMFMRRASGSAGGNTSGVDSTGAKIITLTITRWNTNAATTIVEDSKGNVWTKRRDQNSTGAMGAAVYDCINPITGTNHTFGVRESGGGNCFATIVARGFSGGTFTFDAANSTGTGSTLTTRQPGSVTPVRSDNLFVTHAAFSTTDATAVTINSGFTMDSQGPNGGGTYGWAAAYKIRTANTTAENPTFTWAVANDHSAVIAVYSETNGPIASFTTSIDQKTVTVTDASTAGGSAITSWLWSWGDGSPDSTGQVPGPHTYSVGGTYTITLTVSDGTLSDDGTGSITTKTRRYVTVKTVGGRSATASVDVNDA